MSTVPPPVPAAPATASMSLCANLMHGMHAAAQPLTILRASLGKDHTDHMSIDQHRELAESSAHEIERLCTFFNYMQQLIVVDSIQPHLCAAPIHPLLEYTVEGVSLLFKDAEITLDCRLPDLRRSVWIDSARTSQALSCVLLTAHAVSRANDVVELSAEPSSGGVLITVRNRNSYSGSMDAERTLSLALAEANIRSQQGKLTYTLQPFCVQIELPTAPAVQ